MSSPYLPSRKAPVTDQALMRAGGCVAQQMAVEMLFAQKGLVTVRIIADKRP